MWSLSSPTRDWIHVLCIRRQVINHWTTREIPVYCSFPWILVTLVFPDSQLFLFNSRSRLSSTHVTPSYAAPWKLFHASKLGQLQGSPCSFSVSKGSLSFITWCPVSWKLFFHFFSTLASGGKVSLALDMHLRQRQMFAFPVQSLSCALLFVTPWIAAHQASLSFTVSQSLLMYIESMMPSNHFILCHPLLLLPSIFPSIRLFSSEEALHIRWPKDWSFSFSISPSNEYSGLISFRMDWFDLAVQGTLKCLLQHHSLKASILWCSAFLWSNSYIHMWLLEKS